MTNPGPGGRLGLWPTIRDARGHEVTLLDPIQDRVLHRHSIDGQTLETVVREIDPTVAHRGRLIIMFALGVLAFIGGLVTYGMSGGSILNDLGSAFENPATFVPVLATVVAMPMIFMAQKRHRRIRTLQVLLHHRLCPHCGYMLRGVPSDPEDDATVCPECAAAWRFDRPIGTSAPCCRAAWKMVVLALAGVALGLGVLLLLSR